MDYKLFDQVIKKYDIITIYHHEGADNDCLGASNGLKEIITSNFKNKKVYILGKNYTNYKFPYDLKDEIDDSIIKQSLAIVVDTANSIRVDGRYQLAKEVIKVDHHIEKDPFGNYNFVNSSCSSCCEILADICRHNNYFINKRAASCFYLGMISDTISFSTNSTNYETLEIAAYLVKCGADPFELNRYLRTMDFNIFKFKNHLRNNVIFDHGVAYIIIKSEDYLRFDLDFEVAKNQVNELAGVQEFKIWLTVTENNLSLKPIYNVSVRSSDHAVNEIAEKYGGGGHKFASGIKVDDLKVVDTIIKEYISLLEEINE